MRKIYLKDGPIFFDDNRIAREINSVYKDAEIKILPDRVRFERGERVAVIDRDEFSEDEDGLYFVGW